MTFTRKVCVFKITNFFPYILLGISIKDHAIILVNFIILFQIMVWHVKTQVNYTNERKHPSDKSYAF